MQIHFSAPLQDLDERIADYQVIAETVRTAGHELIRDWLKDYQSVKAKDKHFTDEEWKRINADTLSAIKTADAVIVEASISSFSMGYVSAMALANKKSLLMLFKSRGQPYVLDVSNSLRRAEVYHNTNDLKYAVSSFLKDVDVDGNNLRFNMVLDHQIYNFLNWESVNSGKTKAQIVREILKQRIKQKD